MKDIKEKTLSKSRKLMIKFARNEFKADMKYLEKHDYHCGVRFYSDDMVNSKLNEGKNIGKALEELAIEDFRSL